jgi:hypothetical protein
MTFLIVVLMRFDATFARAETTGDECGSRKWLHFSQGD